MIEITDEIITRFETLLHDNVGYAASRNADRILADLVKQAEITEKPSSEIPVAVKFHVVATAEGQLNLVLDDVSWKVLSRSKDDNFYTVGIDPKQPNLPGFDQPEPKPNPPVVEAKALPAHEDDDLKEIDMAAFLTTCQVGLNLMEACKRNVEAIADANCITVLAPSPYGDSRVIRYAHGEWKLQVVPNVQETLEAADDGECIVFDADGKMTRSTMDKLKKNGYGVLSMETDGVSVRYYSYTDTGCWKEEDIFDHDADGCLLMVGDVCQRLANDDCLLMDRVIFYGLK